MRKNNGRMEAAVMTWKHDARRILLGVDIVLLLAKRVQHELRRLKTTTTHPSYLIQFRP